MHVMLPRARTPRDLNFVLKCIPRVNFIGGYTQYYAMFLYMKHNLTMTMNMNMTLHFVSLLCCNEKH